MAIKIRVLSVAAIYLGLGISNPVMADHSDFSQLKAQPTLNLGMLVEAALHENAQLQALRSELAAKSQLISVAGAPPDPGLSVEAMNYSADSLSRDPGGASGVQVALTQSIPFPGKLRSKQAVASYERGAEEARVRELELEITKKVRIVYFSLAGIFAKFDSLDEKKAVYIQLISNSQKRFSLGKMSQAELLNLQVENATVYDEVVKVERMISDMFGELNHLLGRSDHGSKVYGRPEPISRSKYARGLREADILKVAEVSNPALKSSDQDVLASSSRVDLARRAFYPDFDLKVGYTFREPTEMDDGKDMISAMVGVSIPVWSGSRQAPELDAATSRRISAEANRTETKNALVHEIHLAFASLSEARKRIEVFETAILPLSRQALNTARTSYTTGGISYDLMISSITRWFDLEVEYVDLLRAHETSLAQLEALAGRSLKEIN
ncbi:MAG: TolC family protein [Oligoflexales bacterium]